MRILQVKKSTDFKKIGNPRNKQTLKFFSKTLILLAHKTNQEYLQDPKSGKMAKDFCRVGYTVSKKVGNAVTRNKAKRRLRELFKDLAPGLVKNHFDYVIIAKKEISGADFDKISSDLKFCLKRIHTPAKNDK
jgi:ribonuclease P protein component